MPVDDYVSFELGCDNGRDVRLLPRNKVRKAINMTIKGGFWKTRPGFHLVKGRFKKFGPDRQRFKTGRFQGMHLYQRRGATDLHISIDGHNFRWTLDDNSVRNIDPPSGPGDATVPRVVYAQHDRYLLKQDGISLPVVIDGALVRNPRQDELPIGFLMASGGHYLALSNVARTAFRFSDLNTKGVGGVGGTPDSDPLSFADSTTYYLGDRYGDGGAGSFAPTSQNVGQMTYLAYLSELDTTTGFGNLVVGFEEGHWAYNTNIPRADWVSEPIGRQVLQKIGGVSQASVVHLNADLGFRSRTGRRTIRQARRDYDQKHDQRTISHEMDSYLKYEDERLLWAASGCIFDEQWLDTLMPERMLIQDGKNWRYEVVHRGMMAYEYDVTVEDSAGNQKQTSAYSGLWTLPGRKILMMVSGVVQGVDRCYVMAKNVTTKENELWELTKDSPFDNDGNGNIRIRSRLDLGVRSFQSEGGQGTRSQHKLLKSGEVWLSDVVGDLQANFRYKWDGYPEWQDWSVVRACAGVYACDEDFQFNTDGSPCKAEPSLPTYQPHNYPQIPIGGGLTDPKKVNPATGDLISRGHDLEIQVEFHGHCRLDALELTADNVSTKQTERKLKFKCADEPPVCLGLDVKCQNDYVYTISPFEYFNKSTEKKDNGQRN